MRLLFEETETLTHCTGLSLDALPWASSGSSARGSNQPPNSNALDANDDFDLYDFNSIAYFDPGDLTGANGLSEGEIGSYDPEDRSVRRVADPRQLFVAASPPE